MCRILAGGQDDCSEDMLCSCRILPCIFGEDDQDGGNMCNTFPYPELLEQGLEDDHTDKTLLNKDWANGHHAGIGHNMPYHHPFRRGHTCKNLPCMDLVNAPGDGNVCNLLLGALFFHNHTFLLDRGWGNRGAYAYKKDR